MNDLQGQSLLTFMDAPVLVGDPEGRVIFTNPAFQRAFGADRNSPHGESLATLFAGGGREAVLAAVEKVCSSGVSENFRLRENDRGYLAVASPIEADQSRVGVIILFTDEPLMDVRLLEFHREIAEPLEETLACLDEMIDQTGGRRREYFRDLVERCTVALGRARKWSEQLQGLLSGDSKRGPGEATLQPSRVLRQVASRLAPEFDRARVELVLVVGPQVPETRGDATMLETFLVRILRQRLSEAPQGSSISLMARELGCEADPGVLISVVDPGRQVQGEPMAEGAAPDLEPRMVNEIISMLGGRSVSVAEPCVARGTSIYLSLP